MNLQYDTALHGEITISRYTRLALGYTVPVQYDIFREKLQVRSTRQSSAMDLRNYASTEEIKRATMHTTNKAFKRYFQVSKDELQKVYAYTKCDTDRQEVKRRNRKE